MKYYVYVTNACNHNFIYEHDTLHSAIEQCKYASEYNTCILIKGTKLDWRKYDRRTVSRTKSNAPD